MKVTTQVHSSGLLQLWFFRKNPIYFDPYIGILMTTILTFDADHGIKE